MNEKIEEELREKQFRIEDGGDGIFFVLFYVPSEEEQKNIFKVASIFYEDVQWCPDPCEHGEDAEACLNCFYPVHYPCTTENAIKKLEEIDKIDDIYLRHVHADRVIASYPPSRVREAYDAIFKLYD